MERAIICLHWNRHLFQIRICLPCTKASAITTICELTECLPIHCHTIPDNIVLTKELISQQKEWGNGLRPKWFTRSSWHCRMIGMAIKNRVWVTNERQAMPSNIRGLFYEMQYMYTLNPPPICTAFPQPLPPEYIFAKIKGKKWGWLFSLLYIIICLQKFCFWSLHV